MDGQFRLGPDGQQRRDERTCRENKGRDWLGIPGTNGPNLWEGGLPFFDLDGYADLGTIEHFMPYYRNDDQYQTVANLTWLKGRHNIRFGSDMYFTALNHIQPEIADDSFGARGGFELQRRPDAAPGRAGRHELQQLRGVPARSAGRGRPSEAERRALHHPELAVQLLRARSVAGPSEDDAVVRYALRVLPDPDARRSRSRALQPGHQHDGDRRARRRAEGPRHPDAEESVLAAARESRTG